MKKRGFAFVLCLCLTLALLPKAARAAATVTIGGVDLPEGKYIASNGTAPQDDAPASGGYAHLSADGATLYLDGFELTNCSGDCGIEISNGDITLDLAGDSSVTITGISDPFSAAVYAYYADLTVRGSGSLTAESGDSNGIVASDLTINGGKLIGDGLTGIDCYGDLTVTGGELIGSGYDYGVSADSITVSGGEVTGYATSGTGLYCDELFSVSGGKVRGRAPAGIAVGENLASPQPGRVEITGGAVVGEGGSNDSGLFVADHVPITISGGVVEFTDVLNSGAGVSVTCDGASLTISGGTVKLVGTFRAVFTGTTSRFSLDIPPGYSAKASENSNGAPLEQFTTSKLSNYKYFRYAPGYAVALYNSADVPLTAHTFPAQQEGYGGVPPLAVTVKNTGANDTGPLSVTLSGADAASFTAMPTGIYTLEPDESADAAFTVAPVAGLAAKTYNATVTVGNASLTQSFAVQFTVNAGPSVTVTPTGGTHFPAGGAAGNAAFRISSSDGSLNATNGYGGGATLDGQPLSLGSVGSPGTDGSVANGSLLVTINQAKLNTLAPGDHVLLVTLSGAYASSSPARGVITVTGDGAGGSGDSVPKTGDGNAPLLWLGLVLLSGAGLTVSAAHKKRKQTN